jgi:hypothetical protein
MAEEPFKMRDFPYRTPPPLADGGHFGESRAGRARAEELFLRYPQLDRLELAELLRWYRREASAMDVALVASNDRLRSNFEAFHARHIQPFSWKDKLVTGVLGSAIIALLAVGLLPEAAS